MMMTVYPKWHISRRHVSKCLCRRGFSLIELLTVIAIISVLAALLYPVIVAQQAKAHRNACAANLAQIAGGIRMYKLDTGYYPPVLYGFVHTTDEGTPGNYVYGLYPHWVRNATTFACVDNPLVRQLGEKEATRLEMNGAAQAHLTPVVVPDELRTGRWTPTSGKDTLLYPHGIQFAMGDSYDVSYMPTKDMLTETGTWERHYQLEHTPVLDLATNPDLGGLPLMGATAQDRARTYARQLVFRNPDDSTMVTTCTYHRNYPAGWTYSKPLPPESTDVVLFLDGHVEMRRTTDVNVYSSSIGWGGWQITEK
jgi:prepilin-type N-terminal cleavage/methylation domain-containing protein